MRRRGGRCVPKSSGVGSCRRCTGPRCSWCGVRVRWVWCWRAPPVASPSECGSPVSTGARAKPSPAKKSFASTCAGDYCGCSESCQPTHYHSKYKFHVKLFGSILMTSLQLGMVEREISTALKSAVPVQSGLRRSLFEQLPAPSEISQIMPKLECESGLGLEKLPTVPPRSLSQQDSCPICLEPLLQKPVPGIEFYLIIN